MKQIIQNYQTGNLTIEDVPPPALAKEFVLVENQCSLISTGTEKSTLKIAQASLLNKARQRPDLVAQVWQNIRREGFLATYQKVRTKLDSLKALGYSSSGVVMASMDTDGKFLPGDRVACAGQDYASHAEIGSIPKNLIAKIPNHVSFEEASFTTLGAIALQGIRQADIRLGETICVIGLGLLGQLTCQLAKASGCRVVGIDFSEKLVQLASDVSADLAVNRQNLNPSQLGSAFHKGNGFDRVIITAATLSNDPIILATELCRKKGKIIVVGAVKMDIPREPHFYRKELELRISCSYGPGRYDSSYEEEGHDYPLPYVRWTEQRNMEAFLDMIARGAVKLDPLISHTYTIDEAQKAYDHVLGKYKSHSLGIIIRYPNTRQQKTTTPLSNTPHPSSSIVVGFVGAGSFAQSYLIPYVKKYGYLHTVVTSRGITAKNVVDKFNFANPATSIEDITKTDDINVVFIATPHNTHAEYTASLLQSKKHVFVEKPLAITPDQLKQVEEAYAQTKQLLMVGYNRRFSPAAIHTQQFLASTHEPRLMNFRVNAGYMPKDHWTQNPNIGGGRILGEVCHFVDLMQFFAQSNPVSVFARSLHINQDYYSSSDNVVITLCFANGSIGTITYTAIGDSSLPKEYLEIFCGGKVATIHDFKFVKLFEDQKQKKITTVGKGHAQEVKAFIQAIQLGHPSPIPFDSQIITSRVGFAILDSLSTDLPQNIA